LFIIYTYALIRPFCCGKGLFWLSHNATQTGILTLLTQALLLAFLLPAAYAQSLAIAFCGPLFAFSEEPPDSYCEHDPKDWGK